VAFVVKVQNGKGDGAGRSRYLLKDPEKVLAVSTNIPSPSLILGDYRSLADDFNRILLARQRDYRTDHFVISFQHRFSQRDLEKITQIIETEFQKTFGEDRPYLIVVHAENFKNKTPEKILEERLGVGGGVSQSPIEGTSFHVVMGRNAEGKGIRLSKRDYMLFKRRMIEKLQEFMNEREKEVFQHFLEGKRERDFYKKGELYKPEKLEKVWAKKILKEVTEALEKGDVRKAVEVLEEHNAEIRSFEISPYNHRKLKEPTPYILLPRINKDGIFAVRLRKAERVLYEKYRTVFEEVKNESERISEKIQRYRERVRRNLERNRGIEGFEERIRKIRTKLARVREIGRDVRRVTSRVTSELADELGISKEELEQLKRESEQFRRENGYLNEGIRGQDKGRDCSLEEAGEGLPDSEVGGQPGGRTRNSTVKISERGSACLKEGYRRSERKAEEIERLEGGHKRFEGENRGNRRELEGGVERCFGLTGSGKGENKKELDSRDGAFGDSLDSQCLSPLPHSISNSPFNSSDSSNADISKFLLIGVVERKSSDSFSGPSGYRIVISDREDVLKKLGAVEIRRVRNADDIAEVWKEYKCLGYVELYLSDTAPDWVNKGIQKAVWTERKKPPCSTREIIDEHRPTEVRHRRYFDVDGELILDVEIEREPQKYLSCANPEVRKIASIEMETLRRSEDDFSPNSRDGGIDLGM
jgi:hypothetical protein